MKAKYLLFAFLVATQIIVSKSYAKFGDSRDYQITEYSEIEIQSDSEKQIQELKERLLLTEEQLEKITPIILKAKDEINTLKKKNYDQRAMMEEMKKIMDKQAEEISKYLTQEQNKKFENLRKQKEEEMKQNRPKPGRN